MTPEQAGDLRKPFPKSAIGKLPKAGMQLDYVGHAATTDRLLSVDPEWTWEPMAVDEYGAPKSVGGNLWIRLTVCGVTRIGCGDGSSAKEAIGDAIRNAAMRFGVALDLWSKEELEQAHGPSRTGEQSAPPPERFALTDPWATSTAPPPDDAVMLNTSSNLAKRMYASINDAIKAGQIVEDGRLPFIGSTIGRDIESTKQMTETEAKQVLARLDEMKEAAK